MLTSQKHDTIQQPKAHIERELRNMKRFAGMLTLTLVLVSMLFWVVPTSAQAVCLEPAGAGTPVITKNPTSEEIVEGETVVFIARADNTRQYAWELVNSDGNTIPCAELPEALGKVTGANSEKLVISNVSLSLDGSYIRCRFVGAEESVYSDYAELTVISVEDAVPVITKHPGKETVTEGESAQFTARADYTKEYLWQLISPNGKTVYECKDAAQHFAGVKITGYDKDRLKLENIPLSMDGWKVRCIFTGGGGSIHSETAKITVLAKEGDTEPTTEATEPASQEPTQETTPVVTEPSADAAEPSKPANNPSDRRHKSSGPDNTLLLVIIAAIAVSIVSVSATVIVVVLKKNRM
jgi:predicted secreted protein